MFYVMRNVLMMVALAIGAAPQAGAGQTGKLVVEVSGFRSDHGQLMLRLYDSQAGFPIDGAKAVRQAAQAIKGGRAVVELDGVPFGSYAIGCIHDENGNGRLDTNLIGIPKEGVCASNDARGRRGPPRWSDARFDLRASPTTLQIHMRY